MNWAKKLIAARRDDINSGDINRFIDDNNIQTATISLWKYEVPLEDRLKENV